MSNFFPLQAVYNLWDERASRIRKEKINERKPKGIFKIFWTQKKNRKSSKHILWVWEQEFSSRCSRNFLEALIWILKWQHLFKSISKSFRSFFSTFSRKHRVNLEMNFFLERMKMKMKIEMKAFSSILTFLTF